MKMPILQTKAQARKDFNPGSQGTDSVKRAACGCSRLATPLWSHQLRSPRGLGFSGPAPSRGALAVPTLALARAGRRKMAPR